MNLSRAEILSQFSIWLKAWNEHDLDGVLKLIHEDILFENWNSDIVSGKNALRRSWTPWFIHHGNFKFIQEDIFFDEQNQKMMFRWRLEWPSIEKKFIKRNEIRRGVDILEFKDGKIYKKISYSKTRIQIDSLLIDMHAV